MQGHAPAISSAPLSLAMVAGETSGDLLAGLLLEGVRARWPDARAYGIGGPKMQEQGFEAWWPHEKLAVRGYIEVLRHYREIVGIRRQLRTRLLAQPPRLFVGVDAPDFNLDLARDLKAQGIPCVQFVCPSIWAWRADRVHRLRASVDHVLCLFPFEPALLRAAGVAATYVGHPLANVIAQAPGREAARAALGLSASDTVLALLPGSRASEIAHLAERFVQAAQRVTAERPGLRCVLPAIPSLRPAIEAAIAQAGGLPGLQVLQGQSHLALAACDVTLIASGTATLEAALFARPMVIAYHMHPLSWWIMQRKRLQPWVGLPNILAGEFLVPERLQEAATPKQLAHDVLAWLDDPARMQRVQHQLAAQRQTLQLDTPELCVHAIEEVLAR